MLYAENSEFRGDPCVDIGKYLEVGIELILPVEIFLKGQGAFLFLRTYLDDKDILYLYDTDTCLGTSWCPY